VPFGLGGGNGEPCAGKGEVPFGLGGKAGGGAYGLSRPAMSVVSSLYCSGA
jgi:hypothetical protein